MKKFGRLFLSIAVAFCAVFAFVGCGDDNANNPPATPPTTPPSYYQSATEVIDAAQSKISSITYYQVEMTSNSPEGSVSSSKFEQTQDKLKIILNDEYYERYIKEDDSILYVKYIDEINYETYDGENIFTIEYILGLKDEASNVSMVNNNGTYVVKFDFSSDGGQDSYINCYFKDDKVIKCEQYNGGSDDIFILNYKYENVPVNYGDTVA